MINNAFIQTYFLGVWQVIPYFQPHFLGIGQVIPFFHSTTLPWGRTSNPFLSFNHTLPCGRTSHPLLSTTHFNGYGKSSLTFNRTLSWIGPVLTTTSSVSRH